MDSPSAVRIRCNPLVADLQNGALVQHTAAVLLSHLDFGTFGRGPLRRTRHGLGRRRGRVKVAFSLLVVLMVVLAVLMVLLVFMLVLVLAS